MDSTEKGNPDDSRSERARKAYRAEHQYKGGSEPMKIAPWEEDFLEALELTYLDVSGAARMVRRGRSTVYKRRQLHPKFKAKWENVVECVRDSLEGTAMRKAIEGWLEPIYYQGKAVGVKRIFSPGLTIFMLKCHRPDRYNIDNPDAYSLTAREMADKTRDALKEAMASVPLVPAPSDNGHTEAA